MSDSTVGGTRYYVDQYKRLYRYENDTLEVSFRFAFNPWPPLHSFGNVDCAGFKAVTITTDSASYLCQPITYVYSNSGYYDSRGYKFSPGIGLVRFDEHTSTPSSGSDVYTAWQLFSYQLQR